MMEDKYIDELKREIHNLKERYTMLRRFVRNMNEEVNCRVNKI